MAVEFGLGRFGDRRLEKGGPRFTRRWSSDLAVVCGGLRGVGPRRFGSGAFCAIAL
jgi:hypothetical protein